MFNFLKINNNKYKSSGFTLMEILIIIAIVTVISSIVLFNLSNFRNEQDLKNAEMEIVSLLDKARQNTLSSVNSNNYSVHFEVDKAVLFSGSIYSALDSSNEKINFNANVSIPAIDGINLGGGGNDVTFERLTGETMGGTLILRLKSDASKQKTITINKTGLISSN
ncbi:MAG: prepilin-type N-terminal cleavage/methylation domain-containing protein [Candidatus Nomurabacteria bacterium]